MKKVQTSFKPLEIDRNRELKTRLERQAKFKIHLLEEARTEALKYAPISDFKAFSEDIIAYTIKHILRYCNICEITSDITKHVAVVYIDLETKLKMM